MSAYKYYGCHPVKFQYISFAHTLPYIYFAMGLVSKITLIPWDSQSEAHVEWLVKQRVECSWHQGKVRTEWIDEQQKGIKCIFWIVSFYLPYLVSLEQKEGH
jgi:hypothetical protein